MNQFNLTQTNNMATSSKAAILTRNAAHDEYIDDLIELTTGLSPEEFDELYPELAR
ncbi:hypothetical protein ACOI22_09960 [Glaciecola sp. 2405UD65-10]|uniref:hypothetical protein n=1 Tax=Glaciecola sp. 2405UD65-10 TaxID=3397244 RepID=UPI003B5BADAE